MHFFSTFCLVLRMVSVSGIRGTVGMSRSEAEFQYCKRYNKELILSVDAEYLTMKGSYVSY